MPSEDVDRYIASQQAEVAKKLESIRKLIWELVPDGVELISYGVPTVKLNGKYVVYYAAFKKHISIYPVFDKLLKNIEEAAPYKTPGKGTISFPLDKELPIPLIKKVIIELRKENLKRTMKI